MAEKAVIIGAGISGMTMAHCLKDQYDVKIFEKDSKPGGLIKCTRESGHLYHQVGGHVFNSKRQDVLDWFWKFFDKDKEFLHATRNATISIDDSFVGYPIENNIYMMNNQIVKSIIDDLLRLSDKHEPQNFEEFLICRFGQTLYNIYFQPYNKKIWRKDLKNIPLSWLEGKLPMPSVTEIILHNFKRTGETNMVHSSFYYPRENGSQFLADRLAENLDISYNSEITEIKRMDSEWIVNGVHCSKIVFCGNIKDLPKLLPQFISPYQKSIEELKYHGTTTVLCEIDKNPYSWVYMPSEKHEAHRIICTGNFAESNNANGKLTGTIEFTDYISESEIHENLKRIPFSPNPVASRFTPYTYPIQHSDTREMVNFLKTELKKHDFYMTGRFADWEYYNMDAAIGAAIDLEL